MLASPYPNVVLSNYETSPDVALRLANLQKRLDNLKVIDIHFSFNYEALAVNKPSIDELTSSICNIVEATLDGNVTELSFLEDETPNLPDDISSLIRNTTI